MAKEQEVDYVELMRQRIQGITEDSSSRQSSRNDKEFVPEFGESKIRLLPALGAENGELFYHTHSYHYVPGAEGKKAKYVWSKKSYEVNGKTLPCPFDDAAKQWYATKDKTLVSLAQQIKRKRHFFANIILADKYRILIDTSAQGKLIRLLCSTIGMPFMNDVEDGWIDEKSKNIDPDKEYKNLLSLKSGYDFKIVKEKDGVNNWDFNYEKSFALKPRPLTPEELALLDERIDLKTYKEYEQDYDKVKSLLEAYIETIGGNPISSGNKTTHTPGTPAPKPAATFTKKAKTEDVDVDEDALIAQLS